MFNEYPYVNLQDINLDFILKKLETCIKEIESLDHFKEEHEAEYEALKKLVDDLYKGNFPPSFIGALYEWCNRNIIDIIGELSTHVFFGLTESGYFVAYIPESWNDIIFNTSTYDLNVPGVDYGHLILSY